MAEKSLLGQGFSIFMPRKYYYIAIIAAILAVAAASSYLLIRANKQMDLGPKLETTAEVSKNETASGIQSDPKEIAEKRIVSIAIENERYQITAREGTSALEAMRAARDSGLAFDGKEFPGLGFFVESINGRRNADGYYWILYVNGTSSQTGASQTLLKNGDRIEWKYERSY